MSANITTSSSSESEPEKLDLILKFRAITEILHALGKSSLNIQPRTMHVTDHSETPHSKAERNSLRALVALATLLVRNNEVAAVATKNGPVGPSNKTRLEIIACGQDEDDDIESPVGRSYTVSTNPRTHSDLDPTSNKHDALTFGDRTGPTVITPEAGPTLTLADPLPYVIETWGKQTFQTHGAAVISLLNQSKDSKRLPESAAVGLPIYIIAKCYRKMYRRMTSKVSARFLKPITSLTERDINAVIQTSFSIPNTTGSKKRDLDFAKMLSQPFMEKILKVNDLEIPNLMQHSREKSHPIYRAQTCRDFHRLLCALLEGYQKCLSHLQRTFTKMTPQTLLENKTQFQDAINITLTYMSALRTLIQSSAISEHLEKFHHVLDVEVGNKGVNDDDDDEEEEEDTDLIGVQPMTMIGGVEPLSVCNAYKRWLRLQVTYLESAAVLTKLASKFPNNAASTSPGNAAPDDEIMSIKVIAIGHQGSQMHPWELVIRDIIGPNDTILPADDAINLIRRLMSNDPVLKRTFSRLSTGEGFRGTLHCEACLASLMRAISGGFGKNIQIEFADVDQNFIGVSKRCCPVCSRLLSILGGQTPIQIQGSHKTIYPCTLPPWLPTPILQTMVTLYGRELKRVLRKLWQTQDTMRKRTESAESQAMSPPSSEDEDESSLKVQFDQLNIIASSESAWNTIV